MILSAMHRNLFFLLLGPMFLLPALPAPCHALQRGGGFVDSGQMLGSSTSADVAFGDLDGDGDIDAFVANYGQANKVWLNDGAGNFIDSSGQALGASNSEGVSLGDVDGDGDLDAFVANYLGSGKVWLNDGAGNFADSGQSLGVFESVDVDLGDLDGDGDLDAFVANGNYSSDPSTVWLNDGAGNFTDGGQVPTGLANAVRLGDVDGDGDLDALVANNWNYLFSPGSRMGK